MSLHETCPCGRLKTYETCCQPYHQDPISIPTAEALVHARYSAFVLRLPVFIKATMLAPALAHFEETSITESPIKWQSLDILQVKGGTRLDDEGEIEFRVICLESEDSDQLFAVRETSLFKREENQWYYVDALTISREII